MFPISLGSHPHPLSTICLNNRVHPLTTKKSHLITPGSNESAGKKKSVRITRAGIYLKPALVQCAHAAVKSDKSPYYKKKYDSLVKRRGKKRAIIAIARMILTAIYQMLSTGEQWNPIDLYKIDMPVALVEKQKAKAIKQAKKLLQREGLFPPDEPLAS